jgi:hypothetical protein
LPQAELTSGLQPEEFVFLIFFRFVATSPPRRTKGEMMSLEKSKKCIDFFAKGINQIKQNKVLFVQCLCGMNLKLAFKVHDAETLNAFCRNDLLCETYVFYLPMW